MVHLVPVDVRRSASTYRDRKPISTSDMGEWSSLGPVQEFLRGAVRLHILHHATTEDVHGSWMASELARHGYRISPGTLYPTLHRMEEEGLLTSRRQVVDGHARRAYRVTPAGRRALRDAKKALRQLADELLA
jgi:DNA-binding PadR family transcriptional regulator